jgi:hypothetical protein
MKYLIFKKAFVKPLALAAFSVMLLANVAFAGVDSYTIYLNNKLVMKQFVTQPLSVSSLQLDNAAANSTLVVFYNHCGQIGKGRTITVKDDHGNTLKEWKFADATGKDEGMQIPVKDILALQQKNANISLYYAAQQLPSGRMLTAIGKRDKTTAALLPLNVLAGRLL